MYKSKYWTSYFKDIVQKSIKNEEVTEIWLIQKENLRYIIDNTEKTISE